MNSFYYDLILSGLTYVLLTYLTFILMRKRKRNDLGDDDGGLSIESGPEIDLPPGVSWPDGSGPSIREENGLEKVY